MIGVITGDIINSRSKDEGDVWIRELRDILGLYGAEPKEWVIYRGDSFQLIVRQAEKSFGVAVHIKSRIKTIKGLDVRMAIGIGDISYNASKVAESNGAAFMFSGETFERLKKEKLNLLIHTSNEQFNQKFNLLFRLCMTFMDNWTPATAELVNLYLDEVFLEKMDSAKWKYEMPLQSQIAEKLGISQSSVSERYSRAYLEEFMLVNEEFVNEVLKFNK